MEFVQFKHYNVNIVNPRLVTLEDIQFIWPNTDSNIQVDKAIFDFSSIKEQIFEDWEWYPGQDFYGSDIKNVGQTDVLNLLIEANKYPNCVAVNTLGYLKNNFDKTRLMSNSLINPNNGHGIWVKKNYKIPEITDKFGTIWNFYSHMDIYGNDIAFEMGDLFEIANRLKGCSSFNTIGCFKSTNDINKLTIHKYTINGAGGHGIYVLKEIPLNIKLEKIKKLEKVKIFVNELAKKWSQDTVNIFLNNFKFDLISSPNEADIIINHITDNIIFNFKVLNVIISGESWASNLKWDISIGTTKEFNSQHHIYYSQLLQSIPEHHQSITPRTIEKTKFCAYLYNNVQQHRINIFNFVSKYKKVDGLGKCCHNTDNEDTRSVYDVDKTYNDIAVDLYSNYKFVLALENKLVPGYVTEKLLNPLIAGSIPIYWGPNDIFDVFNKKRLIYINELTGDQLIERIKELDEDDEKYNKMVGESWFNDSDMTLDKFVEKEKQKIEIFS